MISAGVLTAAFALQAAGPARVYDPGEELRYRIVQTESRGGVETVLSGETHHRIEGTGLAGAETVSWTRLGDRGSSEDLAARGLAPYRLSLSPGEAPDSPRPRDSVALMGMVTDLQTFYVAVSPAIGIDRLKAVGDVYTRPDPLIGEFGDGIAILSGRDCTVVTVTLVSQSEESWTVRTAFEPPAEPCLGREASDGPPPNFEMVRKVGDGVLDLGGHERFVIETTLDRPGGRIRRGEMVNTLDLAGRSCADESFARCQTLPPIHRERRISLDLIEP